MTPKIDHQQLEKLISQLKVSKIPSTVILSMLSISSLVEINVVQYNCLLFIIKN